MPIEAQIEELRAELKACISKRETRQIERELAALIEGYAAHREEPG
jgi:hypothetical protein